ncbi:hypothetical protein ACFLUR_01480 [Chloroflexota bacterium]
MNSDSASDGTVSGDTGDSLTMEFCALLERWGVEARVKDRAGNVELMSISGHGSTFSIIELDGCPINQISIRWKAKRGLVRDVLGNISDDSYNPNNYVPHSIEYGIPDQRLRTHIVGDLLPKLRIQLDHVRNLPLFGKIINVRWTGKDFDMGIIKWLNRDVSLRKSLVNSPELEINADYYYSSWIMSVKNPSLPSKGLWDCYRLIAQHLLAPWQ